MLFSPVLRNEGGSHDDDVGVDDEEGIYPRGRIIFTMLSNILCVMETEAAAEADKTTGRLGYLLDTSTCRLNP